MMRNKSNLFKNTFGVILILVGFFGCNSEKKSNSKKKLNFPIYDSTCLNNSNLKNIPISAENQALLDNFYKYFWEANNLSGGIIIAQGDKILLEKYRGFTNIEKQIAMTDKTPIHIASVSKVLTSLVILKLIEHKKIGLHQKVNTIFKKFPYNDIEIFHLLTHRSGLINYANLSEMEHWWKNPEKQLTNKDVLNFYTECQPFKLFQADAKFQYCNSNFAILASIAEEITKTSFPELIDEMIFKPLKMKNTYIFQKKHYPIASLSYYNNGKLFPFDRYDLIYGDKNVYSTPRDLFNLSKAMFSDDFLRKSLYDSVFIGYSNEKKGIKNYGLGMRMKIFDNGKKLTYHTGMWHGTNAIFLHLKDENLTIISLGNKRNRSVYSAMSIASIFGDYPIEKPEQDSTLLDSLKIDTLKIDTIQKYLNFESE